jgi:hypothetical protein
MYACVRETGGVHVASGIKAPSYDAVHSKKSNHTIHRTLRFRAALREIHVAIPGTELRDPDHCRGTNGWREVGVQRDSVKSARSGVGQSQRAGAAAHLTRLVVHILAHPDGQGGGAARGGAGTDTTASGGRRRTDRQKVGQTTCAAQHQSTTKAPPPAAHGLHASQAT